MSKRTVSSKVVLYFLMMVFLFLTVGCSSKDNTPPGPPTYSITGTVTGPAQTLGTVVITLTNVSTAATATATPSVTDGTYSFTGLANGTYTLAPALAGYVFDPSTTVVVVNGSNMVQNFVSATTPGGTLYSISGYVYLSGTTTALSGVTVTLGGAHTGQVITGSDGTWTFVGLPGGAGNNYTVTAYLSGYSFLPIVYSWNAPGANSPGNIFYATVAKFSQADLVGTWKMYQLKTGASDSKWESDTFTIDVDGYATFSSCTDINGTKTCPTAGTMQFLMADTSTGLISLTGSGDATSDSTFNATMASNKTFVGGTQNNTAGRSTLMIMQKYNAGVLYKSADLYNKTIVYHKLSVSDTAANVTWEYGEELPTEQV